jgi:hypothetical protein
MRHHLSITVNGEPRDEIALSVAEPFSDIADLSLEFNGEPRSESLRFFHMTAGESDYFDGAYHFQRWRMWPHTAVGTYRGRGLTLRFRDGNCVEAPLADDVTVEVRAPAAEELPAFSIR